MPGEEDYEEVFRVLERGQEKLEDLKSQRKELIEANQKLVKLVKKLQNILEEETERRSFDVDDHSYSFEEGWLPTDMMSEEDLEMGNDPDLEEIDDQVNEVIREMKRAQNFKSK